jgi:hypothetical protein
MQKRLLEQQKIVSQTKDELDIIVASHPFAQGQSRMSQTQTSNFKI